MVYCGITFSVKKEDYGICNEVYLQMFLDLRTALQLYLITS